MSEEPPAGLSPDFSLDEHIEQFSPGSDEFENEAVAAARRLHERLVDVEYQSLHDPLTGLPNRRMFESVKSSLRPGDIIISMDLNGFGQINKKWGDHVGDEELEEIGYKLHRHVRPGDFVARMGGDEFVFAIKNGGEIDALSDAQHQRGHTSSHDRPPAAEIIKRLTAAVDEDIKHSEIRSFLEQIGYGLSAAAEEIGTDGVDAALQRANRRMHEEKRQLKASLAHKQTIENEGKSFS